MANIITIGGSGGGVDTIVVASNTAPDNTKVLWVDTANSNLLKYYNETTGAWTPISAAWG